MHKIRAQTDNFNEIIASYYISLLITSKHLQIRQFIQKLGTVKWAQSQLWIFDKYFLLPLISFQLVYDMIHFNFELNSNKKIANYNL